MAANESSSCRVTYRGLEPCTGTANKCLIAGLHYSTAGILSTDSILCCVCISYKKTGSVCIEVSPPAEGTVQQQAQLCFILHFVVPQTT